MTLDAPDPIATHRCRCVAKLREFSMSRDFAVVEKFVDNVQPTERQWTLAFLFFNALASADWDLAEKCILLGQPIVPESYGNTPILFTVMCELGDRPDVVKWLVHKGAQINLHGPNNLTPLMFAVTNSLTQTATTLLELGADVSASSQIDNDNTALHFAAELGSDSLVASLLAHNADPSRLNIWGLNAAQLAFKNKHERTGQLIEAASAKRTKKLQ